MVSEGPQVTASLAALQADPLNPDRTCPMDAPLKGCKSTVELPDASPQPWIVRNASTAAGEVAQYYLKSERPKNERTVSVYTPAGYRASGEPNALMIVFDRGAYLSAVPTPTILDNLIAASRIPPTVAVFVDNPDQATRTKELTPNPEFPEFLVSELLPWVHARYNVTADPRQTVVAGSSFGGLAATFAALRHPERFGNVLCQSGDFSWAPDHIHVMGRLADATTEPDGWQKSSSEVRSCRFVFTWMPARSKSIRLALAETFSRPAVICATCYWRKDTRFITNSSSAITTI